jgi:hypothetical protein
MATAAINKPECDFFKPLHGWALKNDQNQQEFSTGFSRRSIRNHVIYRL